MSGFVDEAQLNVRGGDGGAGCSSFRREGPEAFGGPNGGDGGKGGDVWLVADRNVASLLAFRDHPHRRAKDGVHGKGKDQHGKRGETLEVAVPEGTVATDLYTGELLADLAQPRRPLAVRRRRPRRSWQRQVLVEQAPGADFAEQGEHGQDIWLKLELKLMADVALVGFPNVGKSTLISVISAAKPKIADYPFTTLEPNLGVVKIDDHTDFVVADIPGLIEGASEGKGLGHQFLRHIERARVLCVMFDLAAVDEVSPEEQERILLHELGQYRPEMLERPRVVVGTKSDIAVGRLGRPARLGGHRRRCARARRPDGRRSSTRRAASSPSPRASSSFAPRPTAVAVERVGEHEFRLIGRQVERVVALNDVTTPEALSYIDYQMKRLGVTEAPGARRRAGRRHHLGRRLQLRVRTGGCECGWSPRLARRRSPMRSV